MISEYELANIITGATRAEGGVARKSSATILGKAVEDSENGMVRVVPEGDVFAPDGDNTIVIPTSPSVRAGDTVQIGLVGGVSKRPMVVAAGGEGDRQNVRIGAIEADYVKASTLDVQVANIADARIEQATIQQAQVHNLSTDYAHISDGTIDNANIGYANVNGLDAQVASIADAEIANATITQAQVQNLSTDYAHITNGAIDNANIGYANVDGLSANYAKIDASNIGTLTADSAWVTKLLVNTGLIAHSGQIFTLDAIQVNAASITAGTIDIERIVVTDSTTGDKHMVTWNSSTSSWDAVKLDGDVLGDRTIAADKIVAHDITVQEITTENLVGTGGWINLAAGTFQYVNATTGDGISWDGSNLTINAASLMTTISNTYTSKNEFAANKSVRFKLLRDSWRDTQWATYEVAGYTTTWNNIHRDSAGVETPTGYDFSTLKIGDFIIMEGVATDSKSPHTLLLKVNSAPSTATGAANCSTVSWVTGKQLATRISQTESEISLVVDDSTTSSSLVLTSQAMDYIGDHVEIKGTDGTTTVISGGQIQTGSLTIGAMSSSTQADILNSNIKVGGRNLLQGRESGSSTLYGLTCTYDSTTHELHISGTNTKTDAAWSLFSYSTKVTEPLVIGENYTLTVYGTGFDNAGLYAQLNTYANGTQVGDWAVGGRFSRSTQTSTCRSTYEYHDAFANLFIGIMPTVTTVDARIRFKFEQGNKATDWSPAPEDEINARKAVYGTCSTAAGTAAKAVTCANFQLFTGARIAVKFSTASTVAAPTLNVNGTGAKAVWYNNAVASSSNPVLWGANATLNFVYDGTEWVLDEKPPSYSAACSTAAGTRDKAATVAGALVVNGTTLTLNFSTANTYASASVRINLSSIGAVDVYSNRAVTSTTNKLLWAANTTLTFVRQGAAWYLTDNGMRKNITHISDNGVSIHAANNPTQNYLQLDSSEIGFYESGSKIARFKAKEIDLGLAPSGPSGADLATKIAMNGGMFSIESSLTEPATSGGTDYQNSLTVMRARSDLLDNWQMTIDDKAFLTMSEMNYGYQTTLRVDGKTQPLVAGVDATSSKTDNTGTLALYGGRILGQTTTNRMGDPVSGYSITQVYTHAGFNVENHDIAISNDVVTIPISFASTSSITWGNQVAATIPAAVAPPTQIRVFVYARSSWSGPLVPAWVNIDTDGSIRINSDAAIVWFGHATYVRKPAGWTAS